MDLDAAGFDQWYSDMAISSRQDEIVRAALGLPADFESSSLLSWQGLAEVVDALQLRAGSVLVDLACGRGGYGMEIARRTGAHVIGVDFSAVAIQQARKQAAAFEMGADVEFVVGDLADTGLASGSADAVVCVDAIQFAEPAAAALAEIRRILRPGGRAVFTCWEPIDPSDERLPERMRRIDLARWLTTAGFESVDVVAKPTWDLAERTLWEESIATDPGDDPALKALRDEAIRVLAAFEGRRRVLAEVTRN